ncbi:peroxidase-related enzyme [Bosea sp. 2YAB26]|jgi:uncharacterized peroxidase-related enzyme|uniref:peroxidase-related enzyme n=1 Tax=Bosea sp. 2YAB26 TaxID=3237478 RepID=UPI003F8F1295
MSTSKQGFTLDELDWHSWLAPVDLATASDEQKGVVKAAWPGAEKSEYFTLLVHDTEVLKQRMLLLNAIMYAPRGLPRAERELSTVAESRINGCPYCASVHGRTYAQLAKDPETIQRIFDEGVDTQLEPRKRAIVDYAARLSLSPPAATGADIDALRQVGLSDLQILDLTQAVAIFAWANRLMQTLGEPVPMANA